MAVNTDMITGAMKTARRRAKISDFRFHDFRHVAQTNWHRKVHVDAAMLAAGHAGVQMHKRYVNLKADDVAEAFGLENGNMSGRQEVSESVANRAK